MSASWAPLEEEIARWRDAGRTVNFWWRDDDANQPGASLARLLRLSAGTGTPLALAVVPQDVHGGLLEGAGALVHVLQHGVTHRNAALAGEKKSEFPLALSVTDALQSLGHGWIRLSEAFPQRCLRVLVPPWNRVSCAGLVAGLGPAGYAGLSRFGPRTPAPPTGAAAATLVEVNTHVDVIDWRGSRGFAGAQVVLAQAVRHLQARRLGQVDPAEPTGWLTHHLVHDAATWDFMERLFAFTARQPGLVWQSPSELFAGR